MILLLINDETENDSLEFAANLDGQDLGMVFKADQGDDNGDTWKFNFADGGILSFNNDKSGLPVSQLPLLLMLLLLILRLL